MPRQAEGKLIELKRLRIYDRMSEETTAFVADLYIDGKNAGEAKNDGHGGSTYYTAYDKQGRELIESAETYCNTLPPKQYPASPGMRAFEVPMDLETFIDGLVEDELIKKENKKLEKKMANHLMWGVPGSGTYTSVKFKATLEMIQRIQPGRLQEYVDKYKREFKPGEQFLNTNLQALGVNV